MSSSLPRPRQRGSLLVLKRRLKMARSAHAYVRGNTRQFYEWLQRADATLPHGPAIWICGDCHVSNIGPVANAQGHVEVQIRDLDQTVIGNPAHDIVRLGLSLAMAARGSDLPGVVTARMMEALIDGYQQALRGKAGSARTVRSRPDAIDAMVRKALRRQWKHLAAERIEGVDPTIPLSKKFWPVSVAERRDLKALMASEEVRVLATSLSQRDSEDRVEMLDAAYWVKGCSSLGLLRYAVLLRIGRDRGKHSRLCLIDIKEATGALAPRDDQAVMPRNHAERIVTGARRLSPYLGERMLAARVQGRAVFVRELLPQDLKLDIEHLSQDEATEVAGYLGNVVGLAHNAQLSVAQRRQWVQTLDRDRPKTIDTPSWLWRSVVQLVQDHEGGYLEHCRRFANGVD